MSEGAPILSIVLVTYNSRTDLERCLPSLFRSDLPLEVIVVDNASRDDTVRWVRAHYPQVRVLALEENTWYAGGNNRGIRAASGRYVLVLNPDTEVKPGALREMLRVAMMHPTAFVTAKLLMPDGTINSCGNTMQYTGITTCLGLGEPAASYSGLTYPLLLSGAAVLAERQAWDDLGGFDERYGMYMEDADLSLRARLKGYEIVCAADAVMTHYYSLNMSPQKFRFLERNRTLTLLKIYQVSTFVRAAPALLLAACATAAYALLKGRPYMEAWLDAYRWLWVHRSEWREARSQIQGDRVLPDTALLPRMTSDLPFDQLLSRPGAARALRSFVDPLFRVLRPYSSVQRN